MGEIFDPLQRYVLRRAPVDVAEDALADTLLVIWRRLERVPEHNPLPWCYGVARRSLSNQRRSVERRLKLVDRMAARYSADARGPSAESGDPDLDIALSQLSDSDRELLHLWAWEQLEPREIAVVLETTSNAISLRLRRAKQKLAQNLERQKSVAAGHFPDKHTEET